MFSLVILIDTNVLYHALDYGIHLQEAITNEIDRDFEIYVHTKVEEEIISDLTKDGKIARQAKLAMELIREFELYEDPREYDGTDRALIETAERINGVVFTFDRELRKRLRDRKLPVLSSYSRGRVKLYGYID